MNFEIPKLAWLKAVMLAADNADDIIAFWDGKSKGTAKMVEIAKKKGIPVRVVRY